MGEGKVKRIITGGLEIIKDSAEELGKTVGPGALIEAALHPGGSRKPNEFSEYLQKSGPNLSEEELKKRKEELSEEEKKQMEEDRKTLRQAVPAHMRPPPEPQELRAYEANIQEKEREKAMQVEAMKKKPKPLVTPVSVQSRGILGAIRRKQSPKGFEGLQKERKLDK